MFAASSRFAKKEYAGHSEADTRNAVHGGASVAVKFSGDQHE